MIEPEPATNISEHGATLNVQINPEGSETEYEIRLECEAQNVSELMGCNPELGGQRWLIGDLGGMYEDETVSVTLADLQPGYIYMYVIFATNTVGRTERGANILQTYPPGAYPEGSPGKQYEPAPVTPGELELVKQEAERITARAEAERHLHAREHEEQVAKENAVRYASEIAVLKKREEEEAATQATGSVTLVGDAITITSTGTQRVASHFPGEFVRGSSAWGGMLCGDHLLGVRRGWWSCCGVAELSA